MSIQIKSEIMIPAISIPDKPFITHVEEQYTHPIGLHRIRYKRIEAFSDFINKETIQYSIDNGRTWNQEIDSTNDMLITANDASWEIINFDSCLNTWNSVNNHFIGIRLERIFLGGHESALNLLCKGKLMYSDHSYLMIRNENEKKASSFLIKYEAGPEIDMSNPINNEYINQNFAFPAKIYIKKK